MNAPVTDTEKLVSSVLEAERQTIRFSGAIVYILFSPFIAFCGPLYSFSFMYDLIFNFLWLFFLCSQLHGKSLFETNNSFLEKHEGYTRH